jgi:hypothetical protein
MTCEEIKAMRVSLSKSLNHFQEFADTYITAANRKGAAIEDIYMNPDNGRCCVFYFDRDPVAMPSAVQVLDFIYYTYNLKKQNLLRYAAVLVTEAESIVYDRRKPKPSNNTGLYYDARPAEKRYKRRDEDLDQGENAEVRRMAIASALESFGA